MSKIICSAAIHCGAYQIVDKADKKLSEAIVQKGRDCKGRIPQYSLLFADHLLNDRHTGKNFGGLCPCVRHGKKHVASAACRTPLGSIFGTLLDAGLATLLQKRFMKSVNILLDLIPSMEYG